MTQVCFSHILISKLEVDEPWRIKNWYRDLAKPLALDLRSSWWVEREEEVFIRLLARCF